MWQGDRGKRGKSGSPGAPGPQGAAGPQVSKSKGVKLVFACSPFDFSFSLFIYIVSLPPLLSLTKGPTGEPGAKGEKVLILCGQT